MAGLNVDERREQIAFFRKRILAAMYVVRERYGLSAVDDGHLVYHHFRFPEGIPDVTLKEWIGGCEQVLLPLLRRTPGWQIFVPDVEWIVETMKLLDPHPRWGCPLCS